LWMDVCFSTWTKSRWMVSWRLDSVIRVHVHVRVSAKQMSASLRPQSGCRCPRPQSGAVWCGVVWCVAEKWTGRPGIQRC
jgi:hypothetical protein